MKGVYSYELVLILGMCLIVVSAFYMSMMKNFTDSIILFETRLAGDVAAAKGIGSTTCTFSSVNKIYFDENSKQINVTFFSYSAPMPYGWCSIDRQVVYYVLGNYTKFYNVTF